MADDLRSLLTDAVAAQETAAEPVEREKPEAAPAVAETEKPASGERPRGPDGKFLPKEAAEPTETEADAEPVEIEETAEPEETVAPAPKIEVPQHWSQADKDMVSTLPEEHRAKVVETYKRIEAGFTPKLKRAAEIERQYGPAEEIFAPHAELLRQRGQVPADVIKAWYSVEQEFRAGGMTAARAAARLIHTFKVDPGDVAGVLQGQLAAAPAEQSAQPQAQLPPEVAERIRALEERENARLAAQQQAAEAQTQARIDAFAAEKDAAGNLAHPYFADLGPDMMALARIEVSQGKTPDLADLYDRAAYANRETRTKLLSAQAEEAGRKAAAERKAKAAAAQKAASSVTGSPGSGQSPGEQRGRARSLREEIAEAAAEIDAA